MLDIRNLLVTNSATRIRSKDAFMLMALWMQLFPSNNHTTKKPLPTGCVLVSPQERILALEHTAEAHSVVRALLSSAVDTRGCDIYVSRFPCALCTKIMVQAGIRKCYYFPASKWEMHGIDDTLNSHLSTSHGSPIKPPKPPSSLSDTEKKEKNKRTVLRLISNNTTALTLYIPQWSHTHPYEKFADDSSCEDEVADFQDSRYDKQFLDLGILQRDDLWVLDESIGSTGGIASRWDTIKAKFARTLVAIDQLIQIYRVGVRSQTVDQEIVEGVQVECPLIIQHAIVLAHIAAKRTDDPKVGVGAVIIEDGKYISVGWNGYPKKAQHLDYPSAGADDCVEDEDLKYDYILHAEQNALLWRNPIGTKFTPSTIMVTTKLPCDECSPMISDLGIKNIYTNRQKRKDRARGLSYEKCHELINDIWIFDTNVDMAVFKEREKELK